MPNVKVIDARKIPAAAPGGGIRVETLITYQEDGGGVMVVTVPKENPTDAEVQAAVKADVETRHRLRGKTFSV